MEHHCASKQPYTVPEPIAQVSGTNVAGWTVEVSGPGHHSTRDQWSNNLHCVLMRMGIWQELFGGALQRLPLPQAMWMTSLAIEAFAAVVFAYARSR